MNKSILRNAFVEAAVIIISASFIALVVNGIRPKGIDLFGGPEKPLEKENSIPTISIDEAISKYMSQTALFIDARSDDVFSKHHIKGAMNLPIQQFDNWIEDILVKIDPLTEIITYCDGRECHQAEELAEVLCSTGFENISHFKGGLQEWIEQEMPVEGSLIK